MKKYVYYAMMVCAALSFSACSDDDNKTPGNTPVEEVVKEFDEVEYLQHSLVRVDEDGKFLYRMCGEPLDIADTTRLYVGAADMAEAQAIFKSLFPETTDFRQKEGGLEAVLKKNAGTVLLKPAGDVKNELAVVTFNTTPVLKYVSSLHFLDSRTWQDDDNREPLQVGDATTISGRKYVCIRAKGQGLPSLFLHVTDNLSPYEANKLHIATEAEAKIIAGLLLDTHMFDAINGYFKNKAGVELNREENVWVQGHNLGTYRWEDFYYYFSMKDRNVTKRNCFSDAPKYRAWMTRTFNF